MSDRNCVSSSCVNPCLPSSTIYVIAPTSLRDLKLIKSGRKGILGILRKPAQYEAELFQQALVEVIYKPKAKIVIKVGIDKT